MNDVSIALATCNGARYLTAQLDSLARQTRRPAELVVCDDRSDDDTVDVVKRFAASAPFPVQLHVNAERLGWRGNFVRAVGLCTGPLIAPCDQDDLWYPDKVDAMAHHFDDPSVLLAFHNADLVDEAGTAYDTLLPIESAVRSIAPLSRPTPWSNPLGLTMVFRSTLAAYNDLWPRTTDLAVPGQRAAHDQWFYYLATNLGRVVSEPRRLLGYRQHDGNSVGWDHAPRGVRVVDAHAIEAETARILSMLEPFCAVLAAAAARGGAFAPALDRAHAKNARLVDRLRRRLALYRARRGAERVARAAALIRAGDYSQRHDWGLGARALMQDLTCGLFARDRVAATTKATDGR